MKLTTEKLLIVSGLGNLNVATSYFLVYLANYDTIGDVGVIEMLKQIKLLQIGNADKFDSGMTWGLGMFWGTMFLVYLTLWSQHEKLRLKGFVKDETIGFGVLPFLLALMYHFGLDYTNYFLLFIAGLYALVTITLYFQERE